MNGILVLDKPEAFTSMDCCAIIRKLADEKKVGHTGTLDPNATGVLPVFIGKATRLIEYSEKVLKSYRASMKLGITTDTQDIWGSVIKTNNGTGFSLEEVQHVLTEFTGEITQIPPMYSAVRINGRRLYDYARSGESVEVSPRTIHVDKLELLSFNSEKGELSFDIVCSKGSYIRTVCNDIGEALGCGAVMTALRRIASGSFTIDMAHSFREIEEKGIEGFLLNPEYAVDLSRKITVNEYIRDVFADGNPRWKRLAAKYGSYSYLNAEMLGLQDDEPVCVVCNDQLVGMVRNGKTEKVFRGLYNEDF